LFVISTACAKFLYCLGDIYLLHTKWQYFPHSILDVNVFKFPYNSNYLLSSFSLAGWFGIRKDFCTFLLGICPCLQEYGNISYSAQSSSETVTSDTSTVPTGREKSKKKPIDDSHKIVMPIVQIDMPDW